MKGRANYLCLHRLDQLTGDAAALPGPAYGRYDARSTIRGSDRASSCRSSASGRRAPRPAIAPSSRICPRICRSGTRCRRPPRPASAPSVRATTTASSRACASAPPQSDVVIVNHHLLCADAAVRQSAYGEVIPGLQPRDRRRGAPARRRRDAVLRLLGQQLPPRGSRARRRAPARRSGAVEQPTDRDEIAQAIDAAARARARVLHRAGVRPPARRRSARAARSGCGPPTRRSPRRATPPRSSTGALDVVEVDAGAAAAIAEATDGDDDAVATGRRTGRTDALVAGAAGGELRDELRFLLRAGDPELRLLRRVPRQGRLPARGADRRLGHRPRAAARSHAHDGADVGDADRGRHVRVHPRRGSASRRGRRSPAGVGVRLRARRRSCICRRGCPIRGRPSFALAAGREVVEILKRTRGRAFVLFTSYATLRAVQAIAEMALDYPMLVQGTAPRTAAPAAVPRDAARGAVRHRRASGRAWTSSARR